MRALITGFLLLLGVSAGAFAQPNAVAIWPGPAPDMKAPPAVEEVSGEGSSYSAISHPTLTAYYAAKPSGAAVVVLPGGGYRNIVYKKEGEDVALRFNAMGIDAYVLKYRLPMESFNSPTAAYQDAQRAIRLVRSGAVGADRKTDPHRIGVIGFSAGGHLAAVMGVYYETKFYEPVDASDGVSARPNFMILGYPAVFSSAFVRGHAGKFLDVMADYPIDTAITTKTTPAFIVHGSSDSKVPASNSTDLASWLDQAKVAVELHIFPGQPHGFAVRSDGPDWVPLCENWLRAGGILPPVTP